MTSGLLERSEMANGLPEIVARLEGITKVFPGVKALDAVSVAFAAGEVHVLFGENGAGKSTIVNVLCGNYSPDGGRVIYRGTPKRWSSPLDAKLAGVQTVFQEFSLIPTMTVQENINLGSTPRGRFFTDPADERERASSALGRLGFSLPLNKRVDSLSRSEQQMVEIAKSVVGDCRLLILDEPTAALTDEESSKIFETVMRLRDEGIAIVYITHRMSEIMEIGDVVSVFRDGQFIAKREVRSDIQNELVELMTGRQVDQLYPHVDFAPGETRLELKAGAARKFQDVDISVRSGEIVGIAGMAGAGKSEVGAALFGAYALSANSSVVVDGKSVKHPTPRRMIRRGVAYLPPDRRSQGLVLERTARENMTYTRIAVGRMSRNGIIDVKRERNFVQNAAMKVRLRPMNVEKTASKFSGGNQQKIVFGRAVADDIRVLIVDDPTVGVDVGAREEIYLRLKEMCEKGVAVLLISNDLNEIIHLCNRIYVMAEGSVTKELAAENITEEEALHGFFGKAQ